MGAKVVLLPTSEGWKRPETPQSGYIPVAYLRCLIGFAVVKNDFFATELSSKSRRVIPKGKVVEVLCTACGPNHRVADRSSTQPDGLCLAATHDTVYSAAPDELLCVTVTNLTAKKLQPRPRCRHCSRVAKQDCEERCCKLCCHGVRLRRRVTELAPDQADALFGSNTRPPVSAAFAAQQYPCLKQADLVRVRSDVSQDWHYVPQHCKAHNARPRKPRKRKAAVLSKAGSDEGLEFLLTVPEERLRRYLKRMSTEDMEQWIGAATARLDSLDEEMLQRSSDHPEDDSDTKLPSPGMEDVQDRCGRGARIQPLTWAQAVCHLGGAHRLTCNQGQEMQSGS